MQKFIFEKYNFDDGAYATEKRLAQQEFEQKHQVQKYSKDEIDAVKSSAFAEGQESGRNELRQSLEQKVASLLDNMAAQLSEREQKEIELEEALSVDAIKLVIGALRKLYPTLTEKLALEEIEAFLKEQAIKHTRARQIILDVNPEVVDEMTKITAQMKEKGALRADIMVRGDESLSVMDLKIDWGYGGVEKMFSHLQSQIEQSFLGALGVEAPVDEVISEGVPEEVESVAVDEKEEDSEENTEKP